MNLLFFTPAIILIGIILLVIKYNPNKNRSQGVTILSVWMLFGGLFSLTSKTILGFILFALCLAVAFGLLKLREWARKATIGIWAFIVAGSLFGVVVSLLAINQNLPEAKTIDLSKELAQLITASLILICLIYFLTRPKVKEQFTLKEK